MSKDRNYRVVVRPAKLERSVEERDRATMRVARVLLKNVIKEKRAS